MVLLLKKEKTTNWLDEDVMISLERSKKKKNLDLNLDLEQELMLDEAMDKIYKMSNIEKLKLLIPNKNIKGKNRTPKSLKKMKKDSKRRNKK